MIRQHIEKAKSVYESHQRQFDVGIFLLGFFFDIFTLGAIDDWFGLTQQLVYLSILGTLLVFEIREKVFGQVFSEKFNKIWKYKTLIFHFLLGSLLSVYTIMFFKSASLITSMTFIGMILALLVLNEFPMIQSIGLGLRTALFTLCLASFFAIHLPLVFGTVSWVPFFASMILAGIVIFLMNFFLDHQCPDKETPNFRKQFFAPAMGTLIVYVFMYLSGLVPPVPISLKAIGIYHKVEKIDGEYVLSYRRPFWKIWQNGAQTFEARTGDQVVCFVTVFSPTQIKDQIFINWDHYDEKQGWVRWDQIPLTISGGREEGFRGYGTKGNYTPGDWRVTITTKDGREIGRISFEVVEDLGTDPVDYYVDRF